MVCPASEKGSDRTRPHHPATKDLLNKVYRILADTKQDMREVEEDLANEGMQIHHVQPKPHDCQ